MIYGGFPSHRGTLFCTIIQIIQQLASPAVYDLGQLQMGMDLLAELLISFWHMDHH